jgi:hypothetical protein
MRVASRVVRIGGVLACLLLAASMYELIDSRRIPPVSDPPLTPTPGPIVTNPAPRPDAPAFVLESIPSISIGKLKGPTDDLHHELWAVMDAVMTETGKVVVINPEYEVRLFDSTGRFIRSLTRRGDGPGEVQGATRVHSLGADTIVVWDLIRRRMSILDEHGDPLRTTSPGAVDAYCCFADGGFVTAPVRDGWKQFNRHNREGRHVRDRVTISFVPAVRGAVNPRPLLVVDGDDPPAHIGPLNFPDHEGHYFPPVPFSRTLMLAVAANDRIVVADGDRYEYQVFNADGSHLRTVRASAAPIALTRDHVAAGRRSYEPGLNPARFSPHEIAVTSKASFATYDALELPSHLPAFGRILTDTDGSVWVGSFVMPDSDADSDWWARFDSTGVLRGTLRVPPEYRVVRFSRGRAMLLAPLDTLGFVKLDIYRVLEAPPLSRAVRR